MYGVISFDRLHVLDLRISRQLSDLKDTILRRLFTIPLSRLINTETDRFFGLPPSAQLSSLRPVLPTEQGNQESISGEIRRE